MVSESENKKSDNGFSFEAAEKYLKSLIDEASKHMSEVCSNRQRVRWLIPTSPFATLLTFSAEREGSR